MKPARQPVPTPAPGPRPAPSVFELAKALARMLAAEDDAAPARPDTA